MGTLGLMHTGVYSFVYSPRVQWVNAQERWLHCLHTHRVVSLWPKPIQMMYSSPHPPSLCWDGRASHALCYGRCWYYILWYLCDICNENNGGQRPVIQSISKCFPNFRKFHFSVSSNTRLRSLQNFAHTPTAVLSGHVQNLVVITLILLKL